MPTWILSAPASCSCTRRKSGKLAARTAEAGTHTGSAEGVLQTQHRQGTRSASAKGKREYDRREDIARREIERDIRSEVCKVDDRLVPPLNEQMDLIRRGAAEIIRGRRPRPEDRTLPRHPQTPQRQARLRSQPARSAPRPSVVLRKLRQFQDLGHQAILIVGDFTGMIGDPSGRSKTRPPLTLEETRQNGQSYFEQATKILSTKKIQMLYNSEWLGKMNFADVIMLGSRYTVARMLERDDFEKRYRAGEPISIHELLYPLAQAMDSVAVQCRR